MAGDGCRASQAGSNWHGLTPCQTSEPGEAQRPEPGTSAERLGQVVEQAVERAIFGGNEWARRRFLQLVGASTASAILRAVFPLETAKALAVGDDT